MQREHFTLHNTFVQWQWGAFQILVLAVVILLAVWYLRADWQLAARGRRWHGSRTASFLAGLLAIDIAFQSSVATYAMVYFQAHVVQHLLLMVVAPPLLALGAPSTLLLQTADRRTKERWLRFLRSRPFAVLSHPVVAWCLYFGVMFAFFLTPLINVAMNHMALMNLLNVCFLLSGMLYWWPMVGIDPIIHWKMSYGARMLNILLGSGVEAFLGVAIIAATRPVASMYTVSSTRAGGGLLWASVEIVTFGAFVPIFIQWSRSEARAGARADSRTERASRAGGAAVTSEAGSSAWEAAWLAKTGRVPGMTAAETAPGTGSLNPS